MARVPVPSHIKPAIEHFGSVLKWAEAVDVKPMTVRQWIRRKSVPVKHAVRTEKESGGAVTKEKLCPDVFEQLKPKARSKAA